MNRLFRLLTVSLLALCVTGTSANQKSNKKPAAKPPVLRANYVIAVTDDMVVNVYLNGKAIPDSKRSLLADKYGASAEKMDIPVHKGDWIVFNIVNNRLRWGGAYYFAVAGCFEKDEFGFVSNLNTGDWSACDTTHDVDRFIAEKTYFQSHHAKAITRVWGDGDNMIRSFAGSSWQGTPLWGSSRNTWVKVIVP